MKRKGLLLLFLVVFLYLYLISTYCRLARNQTYPPAPPKSAITIVSPGGENSSGREQEISSGHRSRVHKSVYPAYKYIGNRYSRKFHKPSCSYLPAKKNRVYFRDREEAVRRKYIPCQKCDP